MSKIFLGIDISKASFDASLLLLDQKIKTKKFSNNKNGFNILEDWLKVNNVNVRDVHACMEATGIYGECLADFLYNINCTVSVVNPARVKGFRLSELSRTKTDLNDSKLIARFCKAINPPIWQPINPEYKELQNLVRRLEDLHNLLRIEKNHLEAVISSNVKHPIECIIESLNNQIEEITKLINNIIHRNPELQKKQKLLETIPGIGESTIRQIMKQKPSTIFAGIIGKGCNIGVDQIANISVGVLEDTLKNTINWCFSLKNIQSANNKIIYLISKLLIANNYRHNIAELHTSSDGRKVNVSVDSILASHSFKYFGKDKGVTVYTYLDERQLLYHFTVISSSEREAAYVIDGLLQNDVIKSSIHSTDTHGYTETVFAGTYFINTAFAPRIKNIGAQTIYGFSTRQTYENRGYKILPSRTINLKLIENNWDDILRFMATMKLKYSSASQLFKRLSSYAKDHTLYRAIKEFGRIIKSIFILTYFDDVELRQRIEKQLNKVEQSNKFANAVFFDNNGEFKYGLKEEQEIAAACKVLIQNAVVLWNYLYLSQLVANINDLKERKHMFELIRKGSVITWQHINFKGEYDFTRYLADNGYFDMAKIKGLQAA